MTTTKSTFKRIVCVLSCCLVVVFSFAVPVSAQTVDNTFFFNIPSPLSNGCDGYVVLPFYYSSSNIKAQCIFWDIDIVTDYNTVSPDGDSVISENIVTTMVNLSPTNFNIVIGTGSKNVSAIVSLYTIWSGDNNSIQRINSYLVNYNNSATFTINFPTSSYPNGSFMQPDFFGGFSHFNQSSNLNTYGKTHNVVWAETNVLYNELMSINEHFVMMLSKMDLTNEQLAEAVSKLNDIYDTVVSISGTLADFVYSYWEEFTYYQLPEQFNAVCSRLDTIIRLLNKKGETEQTTVDSSKVDEYLDIEQSLVNNDEAESALNEFDISIDGQAYSFIWDFITDCFNSHPEVFGLVITILTLGIIALILNR